MVSADVVHQLTTPFRSLNNVIDYSARSVRSQSWLWHKPSKIHKVLQYPAAAAAKGDDHFN